MRPGVVHVAVAASYALVAMYDGAWFHTATALPCESMPTSGDQAAVDASSCTGLPQPSVTENGRAFTCVVPGALVEYTIMALPPAFIAMYGVASSEAFVCAVVGALHDRSRVVNSTVAGAASRSPPVPCRSVVTVSVYFVSASSGADGVTVRWFADTASATS